MSEHDMPRRMYADLSWAFPIICPPEDYEKEGEVFSKTISAHSRIPIEAVLNLGSGGGKICYIASQIVGPTGKVLGVDMNDEMLALAHKYREEIAERIGWNNVEFCKGKIQDLALDVSKFE